MNERIPKQMLLEDDDKKHMFNIKEYIMQRNWTIVMTRLDYLIL